MLQVVRTLVCRDTVALSKWLLQHALTGELQGIAIEVRLRDGAHDVMFTGCYSSPRNALAAAAEIYRRACELFDDHLDTPPWSNKR